MRFSPRHVHHSPEHRHMQCERSEHAAWTVPPDPGVHQYYERRFLYWKEEHQQIPPRFRRFDSGSTWCTYGVHLLPWCTCHHRPRHSGLQLCILLRPLVCRDLRRVISLWRLLEKCDPAFLATKPSPHERCFSRRENNKRKMGSLRFELRTSAMSRRRHNQLDHEPGVPCALYR